MPDRRRITVTEPALLLQRDLDEPLVCDVGPGMAVAFTHRAPDSPQPNEDAIALLTCADGSAVLAVADGAGGQAGGAEASNTALRRLATRLAAADDGAARERILDGIEQANAAIAALGIGAATTIAVAEIHGRDVRPYHVGDSQFLITGQRGRLKLLTISHSPVGYAVEAGLLDEADALHHAERHLVSNLMGSSDMRIEIGAALALAPHDTLLLGSDGVFDNLHAAEICEIVRKGPLEDCASNLARACRARMQQAQADHPSKPDDLGFVLYRAHGRARRA